MDNQHRQIKGYKELSQEEINLMNEIKEKGAEVGQLVEKLRQRFTVRGETGEEVNSQPDSRWVSIGQTNLQQGFMALTRAVAKPEFF